MQANQQQEQFFDIFAAQSQANSSQTISNKLKPEPLADIKLTANIYALIQQLLPFKQVKKGVNQILKEMTKNQLELVVMAADCDPIQIIMILPAKCVDCSVAYCFVESKAALGRACGINRPVVAAGVIIKQLCPLQGSILQLKDKIQQLFV